MIDLKNIRQIYFIGIGGIGMSALASYFAFHGKKVSGYDRTKHHLPRQLESESIPVVYDDDETLAPKDRPTWSFTHPLCLHHHPQLNYYRDHNYHRCKTKRRAGRDYTNHLSISVLLAPWQNHYQYDDRAHPAGYGIWMQCISRRDFGKLQHQFLEQ